VRQSVQWNVIDFPLSIDSLIRFAIAHKRLIKVGYKGASRIGEPHDYGAVNRIDRLFIYQLRGRPSARRDTPWRLLDVPKIESLEVLDETFPGSRGSSHGSHHRWDVVYARVS
jgi:hypothetical protein